MIRSIQLFFRIRVAILGLTFLGIMANQAWSQENDTIIRLTLRLIDPSTSHAVELAHIINLRNERGGISDTAGYFHTRVSKGDMLRVSAIGYFDHYIVIPDSANGYYSVKIPMKEKVYLLNEVRVNTLGNYQQFRNKFLNVDLPDKKIYELQKKYREAARDTAMKYMSPRTGIPLNFPSPEQKIEARKQELARMLREQRIMDDKFNPRIVGNLTGLQGEELYEFMQYCDFSKDFLLRNNHYDILISTLVYFDQWKLMKARRGYNPNKSYRRP